MSNSNNEREKRSDGLIRPKRADTLIGSIEKQYKIDLGVRSDMELGSYLKKEGFDSLSQLLKKKK